MAFDILFFVEKLTLMEIGSVCFLLPQYMTVLRNGIYHMFKVKTSYILGKKNAII